MSKRRRKYSVDQKLQIIQEADQHGVTQTLRKHNVAHSIYLWYGLISKTVVSFRSSTRSITPRWFSTDITSGTMTKDGMAA